MAGTPIEERLLYTMWAMQHKLHEKAPRDAAGHLRESAIHSVLALCCVTAPVGSKAETLCAAIEAEQR